MLQYNESYENYFRYDSKEYDDRTSTQTPNRRNFATRVDRDRQEQDGPESGLRRGHKVLRAPGIANGVSGLVQLMVGYYSYVILIKKITKPFKYNLKRNQIGYKILNTYTHNQNCLWEYKISFVISKVCMFVISKRDNLLAAIQDK